MKITSSEFMGGRRIPEKFTADAQNINPDLTISEIPENTKTLTLIVDDPDAQRIVGYTWIHWIIFNIPVNNKEVVIEQNSIPGTPGESTYKKTEYDGPNPPAGSGTHHYHFKAYALDTRLNLGNMAKPEEIESAMKDHILAKTELIGLYYR